MLVWSRIVRRRGSLTAVFVLCVAGFGCAASEITEAERDILRRRADETIDVFLEQDPSMASWFDDSYGYAVFPTVTKGAAGVGGARGEGVVYEQGEAIGVSVLSQATIGLQLGGQAYSEVIFFRTQDALEDFTEGGFEFDAQASAVALTAGAAANADYSKGVAIFTATKGGLMYEASIGGQNFSYSPLDQEE